MEDAKAMKDFEAHCLKARSNNIFLCPGKIRKGKHNKLVEFLNKKMSKHDCCRSKKKSTKSEKSKEAKNTKKRKLKG